MWYFVGTLGNVDDHKKVVYGHGVRNDCMPKVIGAAVRFYTPTWHKWLCACRLIIGCYTEFQGFDDVDVVNR
jgi:hypothetical protein